MGLWDSSPTIWEISFWNFFQAPNKFYPSLRGSCTYTPGSSNIARKWGPRIVFHVFPIENGDFPVSYVIVYQRVEVFFKDHTTFMAQESY